MKKVTLIFLFVISCNFSFAQFNNQIYTNLIIIDNSFANGGVLGFNQLNKKYNFLIEINAFGNGSYENELLFIKDSTLHKTRIFENNAISGIHLGFISKIEKVKILDLNFGTKLFVGQLVKTSTFYETYLASSNGKLTWLSKNPTRNYDKIEKNRDLVLGFSSFLRADVKILRRLYFLPEIKLGFFYNVEKIKLENNLLGINIGLGYRFWEIKN